MLLCDCIQQCTPSSNPNVDALHGITGKHVAHWAVLCFWRSVAHVNVESLTTIGLNRLSRRPQLGLIGRDESAFGPFSMANWSFDAPFNRPNSHKANEWCKWHASRPTDAMTEQTFGHNDLFFFQSEPLAAPLSLFLALSWFLLAWNCWWTSFISAVLRLRSAGEGNDHVFLLFLVTWQSSRARPKKPVSESDLLS